MGKNRNRQRREARSGKAIHEAPAPVLRLVRSENADIPAEQSAAGLPGEGIDRIPELRGRNGAGDQEESANHVVAAADTGARALPAVERSFDATEFNRITNDPVVFPYVSVPGVDSIDVSPFVQDPNNVLMMGQGGGALFIMDEPGIYEVHTNFLPEYRGQHAIDTSLAAYRWMFTHTECLSILTRIPAFNRPAAFAARKAGFEPRFERKAVWPTPNGPVGLRFYEICYQRWLQIDAPHLMEIGREFHRHLDSERARHGFHDEQHPDEDCHDLYVGACAAMVYGGQPEKAVILYNRWARLAGYGQIAMIARSPLMLNIGNALLQITGDTFKAIKVSS